MCKGSEAREVHVSTRSRLAGAQSVREDKDAITPNPEELPDSS